MFMKIAMDVPRQGRIFLGVIKISKSFELRTAGSRATEQINIRRKTKLTGEMAEGFTTVMVLPKRMKAADASE
jgi:hypothetical protein